MTSIPGCIRNIAVLFSPQLQLQKVQEARDHFISRILSALNSCSFKWPTFNSEFYQRVAGGLGKQTSNISPLSYKASSLISRLTADNTTHTPKPSQPRPSNAQPHQVPHRLPLRQTLEGQNLPIPPPCQKRSLSNPCTPPSQD